MTKYAIIFLILVVGWKPEASVPGRTYSELHLQDTLRIDSAAVKKYNNKELLEFYREQSFRAAWINEKHRSQLLHYLSFAHHEGLDPDEYSHPKLKNLDKRYENLAETDRQYCDVQFTLNALKYLRHLLNGKLKPHRVYANWDLAPNVATTNTMLKAALDGDSVDVTLRRARPNHIVYKKLKEALKIMGEYPRDKFTPVRWRERNIYPNQSDSSLILIKKRLVFWKDLEMPELFTCKYDKQTQEAVKRFQARHGLSDDGIIGKETVAALNFSKTDRTKQILANLERWRWFPRDMGKHYVIINIPAYVMRVVRDGDTVMSKRIVVGKPERATPVLSSAFNEIIINPTWTIPKTIVREDLTPDAVKNKKYFDQNLITITDKTGAVVPPGKWKSWRFQDYRYTQSPGTLNALGLIKFNFPNRFTVFLHDTNLKEFFRRNKRSLSSGCIRVQDALELADYMLPDDAYPLPKIEEIIQSRKTTVIPLKDEIRIHQLYWTAWTEEGKLIFRDDIYEIDQLLASKLRN